MISRNSKLIHWFVFTAFVASVRAGWPTCKLTGKPKFGGRKVVAEITGETPSGNTSLSIAGLASSCNYTDILYYINCPTTVPGDNTVYAIHANNGDVIGGTTISDAVNLDWQAMAIARCPKGTDGESCIYVHDSDQRTIYVIKEPVNPAEFTSKDAEWIIYYDFRCSWSLNLIRQELFVDSIPRTVNITTPRECGDSYTADDRGNKRSETVFVTCDGFIHFFNVESKGRGVRLYKLYPVAGANYTAIPIQEVDLPSAEDGPTAASLSPDCCELLVKTVDKVYYFPVQDNKVVVHSMFLLPSVTNPYCRAIAWALEQCGYYTALKRNPSPLSFWPRNKNLQKSRFSLGTVVGDLSNAPFGDYIGLTASRGHPGFVYIITDRGNDDVIIGQKFQGQVAGRLVTATGGGSDSVTNVNWQDVSSGHCDISPTGHCLYINDGGGENGGPVNIIYIYPEAEIPYMHSHVCDDDVLKIRYKYMGQNFVTRAIIFGCNKRIYVFDSAKNFGDPVSVYELVQISSDEYAAHVIATFPNPSNAEGPLAADLSPCCDELLVKYKDSVKYYKVKENDLAAAFLTEPSNLPYLPEVNGQSVGFASDCQGYYTTTKQNSTARTPLKFYKRLPCCKKKLLYDL